MIYRRWKGLVAAIAVASGTACAPQTQSASNGVPTEKPGVTTGDDLSSDADEQPGAVTSAPSTSTSTQCFAGVSRVSIPTGEVVSETRSVVERKLVPEDAQIVELVSQTEPSGDITHVELVLEVDGEAFVFSADDDSFHGEGRFDGSPWEATSWSSETTMEGGVVVRSEDRIDGDVLTVEKRVLGPDGELQVSIREELQELPADDCESARDAL